MISEMDHPLANRIRKLQKHLGKWARRQPISCYRIYERDLTEYPLILDWYDGNAVAWLYPKFQESEDPQADRFESECQAAICDALQLPKNRLFLKTRRVQKGIRNQYEKLGRHQAVFTVKESELCFEINLSDYLDTGIFLDHRQTRQMVKTQSQNKRVLNLFAYTGTFTCYAIAGGASATTTVDLSPTYSEWTRRNFKLNGFIESASHQIITQDCRSFLKEKSAGKKFDIIICDPPTFSNSKRSKEGVFAVDTHYPELLSLCLNCLAPNGVLFFSTNDRGFKLDASKLPQNTVIQNISSTTVPPDFRNKKIHQCWKIT